jgi:hypothetical protein
MSSYVVLADCSDVSAHVIFRSINEMQIKSRWSRSLKLCLISVCSSPIHSVVSTEVLIEITEYVNGEDEQCATVMHIALKPTLRT